MKKRVGCLVAATFLAAAAPLAAASGASDPGRVERRVALVIGNSAYPTAPLKNPVNDAAAVAEALRGVGFEVIERKDLAQREMLRAIIEFGRRIEDGGVGLFYYAGHGVQVGGNNYMIPVNAEITAEDHVEVEGVDINKVLGRMAGARNRLNIVVLDACRNNPYARSFRSASNGLAQTLAPTGTYIGYAAAPGQVAFDGEGDNSTYTAALVEAMHEKGAKIEDVFKKVRATVIAKTKGAQVPWTSSSITGDFYFAPAVVEAARRGPAEGGVDRETMIETTFWESVADSKDASQLREYLKRYPDGAFAGLAKVKIRQLEKATAATPAPRPPKTAVEAMDQIGFAPIGAGIYASPAGDAAKTGYLAPGEQIAVTGRTSGRPWYRVARPDGSPGYVMMNQLALLAPQAPAAEPARPYPESVRVFNLAPIEFRGERLFAAEEAVRGRLTAVPDSEVIGDKALASRDTVVEGRVLRLDIQQKANPDAGPTFGLATSLFGNVGRFVLDRVPANVTTFDIQVELAAHDRRSGTRHREGVAVILSRDGRHDIGLGRERAIIEAFTEAAKRLAMRLGGQTPPSLTEPIAIDEVRGTRTPAAAGETKETPAADSLAPN